MSKILIICAITVSIHVPSQSERPFLEGSDDLVFKKSPRDIAQVSRIRAIVAGLGCRVATPDGARAMLHLKGQAGGVV